ncbi:MAG: GNAT family N-acetyltransferase, partial [bacterium]|nr:GNAT family N-acetyltransferase [bacterium]
MTAVAPDGLESVSLARTSTQREAVYRLRYDVYMRELRKGFLSDIDHEHAWIRDPEDEQEGVSIFYTGTEEAMTGSLRLQVWDPGRIPEDIFQRFSLHLFPGIDAYKVSEAARLVVRPDMRGGRLLTSLALAAFEHGAANHDVFVCFLYCSPGLVRAYMRLGFRPYPGYVIPNEDGIRLPMFMVAADLEHLKAIGSPLAPLMARHFSADTMPPDMSPFLKVVSEQPYHYETHPTRVWQEVRDQLQPGPGTRSPFLEGISASDAEVLCHCGFIMEIPTDKVVMREGLVERELYLVLRGEYEVRIEDKVLGVLGEG